MIQRAPKRSTAILAALAKTAVFYGAFSLVAAELFAVNLRALAHVPWSMVVAAALLASWMSTVGRHWSRYRLLATPEPSTHLAGYVILSVLACLAIVLIQGALFGMRVESLRLSSDASPLLTITYALLVPLLGAILEEVTFRGILQGNLERTFGAMAAAWTGGITFVALHGWNPAFVPQLGLYVAVAFATGAAATRTKSLLPGMLIHLLINLCLALVPIVGGPLPLGEFPKGSLIAATLVGIVAVVGARWSLRRLQSVPPRGQRDR